MDVRCSQHCLLKRPSFPEELPWFFVIYQVVVLGWGCPGFSGLFHRSLYLFLCRHRAVLTSVALQPSQLPAVHGSWCSQRVPDPPTLSEGELPAGEKTFSTMGAHHNPWERFLKAPNPGFILDQLSQNLWRGGVQEMDILEVPRWSQCAPRAETVASEIGYSRFSEEKPETRGHLF